ncbi:MAG: hypothetical protein ACF8GE_04130 [Phycisphaerales bacterium JB043]
MEPGESAPERAQTEQTTSIRRGWFVKIVVIGVVLFAIGLWGLYDATIVYPARGARHAEFAEFQYLAASSDAAQLLRADVREPMEEFARLVAEEPRLQSELSTLDPDSRAYKSTNAELARFTWLRSLRMIGRLDVSNTTFEDPRLRLSELTTQWQSGDTPKPLKAYDIPMQWLFCVFGIAGALWVALTLVRTASKTFRYDAEAMRLSLPGGASFTPEDIGELDKRQWHKFFVRVNLKDGASHRLDLLRYEGLEEWILEMEKRTEGYEPETSDDSGGSSETEDATSESAETHA